MFEIKRLIYGILYLYLNCFVNHIPVWNIRKILYKLVGLRIGKGSRIGLRTLIECPHKIVIGCRTIINDACYLDGRGGLEIGNDTSVSCYSIIISLTHEKTSGSFDVKHGKVTIGNHVWMGVNSIVLENTRLENGSIIGAGCVFKGVAKKQEIYIGNPAVFKGYRNLEKNYEINYKPYFR